MALVGAFIFRSLVAAGVDLIGSMIGLVLDLFVRRINVLLAIFNLIPSRRSTAPPCCSGPSARARPGRSGRSWPSTGIFLVLVLFLLASRSLSIGHLIDGHQSPGGP